MKSINIPDYVTKKVHETLLQFIKESTVIENVVARIVKNYSLIKKTWCLEFEAILSKKDRDIRGIFLATLSIMDNKVYYVETILSNENGRAMEKSLFFKDSCDNIAHTIRDVLAKLNIASILNVEAQSLLEAKAMDALDKDPLDCEYNHNIICPYCGTEYDPIEEEIYGADGEEFEFECSCCGREFVILLDVTTSYSTYRKE